MDITIKGSNAENLHTYADFLIENHTISLNAKGLIPVVCAITEVVTKNALIRQFKHFHPTLIVLDETQFHFTDKDKDLAVWAVRDYRKMVGHDVVLIQIKNI